jgi:hypothetical protein
MVIGIKIAMFDAHHHTTSYHMIRASRTAFDAVALDGHDENDTTLVLIQ